MGYHDLSCRPLVLEHNRIRRAYTGGYLLDLWQGIEKPTDGKTSEELLVSTVEVSNADRFPGEGLSRFRMADGTLASLAELIQSDPAAFIGEKYAASGEENPGVLMRMGDSAVQLVIQTHPNTECARKYLNFPHGKSEGWYIADCRTINGVEPYLYAGFKKGITREKWEKVFYEQDVRGMENLMHRLPVQKGDVFFVPAGMPHAIGSGVLFLEMYEPCDYTLRMERNYLPDATFTEQQIHYGMGYEKMFDCYQYDGYTEEEILKICKKQPLLLSDDGTVQVDRLMSAVETGCFEAELVTFKGKETNFRFEKKSEHCIGVAVKGAFTCSWDGGKAAWPQGHGAFIPAGVEEMTIQAQQADSVLVIAYPPAV